MHLRRFHQLSLSLLMCLALCALVGCRLGGCGRSPHQSPPRLVLETTGANGVSLHQDYEGERMYTDRYLGNPSGTRVSTIYCGHYSPEALVKARAYMENGRMVRSEHTTRYSPMVLAVEVWDETKGTRIPQGVISQGESRRYFEAYVLREGLQVRHHHTSANPEKP